MLFDTGVCIMIYVSIFVDKFVNIYNTGIHIWLILPPHHPPQLFTALFGLFYFKKITKELKSVVVLP